MTEAPIVFTFDKKKALITLYDWLIDLHLKGVSGLILRGNILKIDYSVVWMDDVLNSMTYTTEERDYINRIREFYMARLIVKMIR